MRHLPHERAGGNETDKIKTTHNTSERLSYYLFAAVSDRRPNYESGRRNMRAICLKCHTNPRILQFYSEAESVVRSTNKIVNEAKAIMEKLRKDNLMTETPFDEPIEYLYFDLCALWRTDGQACAYMGGADFVQWHGYYEIVSKLAELKKSAADLRREEKPAGRQGSQPAPESGGRGPCIRLLRGDQWWARPLLWVEWFLVANVAFLAVDIYSGARGQRLRATGPNGSRSAFSMAGTLLLLGAMAIGGALPAIPGAPVSRPRCKQAARAIGLLVGWGSIVVGIAGLLWHLNAQFFQEQTLKNLVYTAPFAVPLAYTGLGLLLILDRMVDDRTLEWSRWVILLAAGGFAGNFVLSLADHAKRLLLPDGMDRRGRRRRRLRLPRCRGHRARKHIAPGDEPGARWRSRS